MVQIQDEKQWGEKKIVFLSNKSCIFCRTSRIIEWFGLEGQKE